MVSSGKEHKNSYQLNGRLILGLLVVLGFFTIIFLTTMLSASDNIYKKTNNRLGNNQLNSSTALVEEATDESFLAVVKNIDTDNKQITLYNVLEQKEVVLTYTGGANITDSYGQVIAISQIDAGSMVDVKYIKNRNKMTGMRISSKAWKYVGVNNFNINRSARTMRIAKNQYRFTDNTIILDGLEFISINEIAHQDILTIWGNEETIWSITVTRGHGFVILKDYQSFLGDNITIGHEAMQQITDDMIITVREGDFNLTVENGKFSATKTIRVNRNETTYVSLKDLGPGAQKRGRVIFDINPFGADLFISGELMSYADPIELKYGKYSLKVSLGGYAAYEGILIVDNPGKTIKIDLPESSGNEAAEISETITQGNTLDNKNSSTEGKTQSNTQGNISGNTQGNSQQAGSQDSENEEDNTIPVDDTASTNDDKIIDTKHKIHIQNPLGASVYLDGEYMGTSPLSFNKIIGSHVITFIEDGHETMSYIIEVSNDGTDAYFTFPNLISKTEDTQG